MDPGCTTNLLDLLSNHLVFSQISPHLPAAALLSLSATSKTFRHVVYCHPNAFRRLDLSAARGAALDFPPIGRGGAVWRTGRGDEAVTEDDFYGAPLRGIFSWLKHRNVLSNVHTLVLDGQSAPAEVLREILCDDKYQVRILSLIDVLNLNMAKFYQVVRYATRLSRPRGTPRIKGIYFFGTKLPQKGVSYLPSPPDSPRAITASMRAPFESDQKSKTPAIEDEIDPWYKASGEVIRSSPQNMADWAILLESSSGLIAWDAVLCRGPKHEAGLLPKLAAVALGPRGCESCGSSPEGPGTSPYGLPLLGPPPLHSSSLADAQRLPSNHGHFPRRPFFARCRICLEERRCEECGKWWCEDCYQTDGIKGYVHGRPGKIKVNRIKVC
jgi:hypothetical protein